MRGASMAGAAALISRAAAQTNSSAAGNLQVAQAPSATTAPRGTASGITVRAVERLAGSTTNFAYAVKAGPWIFLNGHEAFDFEKGLAPEVEGTDGNRLSGRPPLRREADY